MGKGWGIEVKGKLEDIQKGLVDKTMTHLLFLDVSGNQVKQKLTELEQKASRSYPSLQIQGSILSFAPHTLTAAESGKPATYAPLASPCCRILRGVAFTPPPPLTEPLSFVEPEVGYLPSEGLLE